ncbi:MAG: hypothetical protein SX243_12520 [Acidobacteriota bacterium]|nr:hypothetical protein [Acidobacteriota bacterium]
MPSRRRRFVLSFLTVAVVLGALTWFNRDLPRRQLAASLSESFGGAVTLEHLRVLDVDRVLLRGLEIQSIQGMPWIGGVRLEEVEAHGSIGDLRAGRLKRMEIRGGRLTLEPPPWPEEEPLPPSDLELGVVTVRDFEVVAPAPPRKLPGGSPQEPSRWVLQGEIIGWRGALAPAVGLDLRGKAEALEIGPLASFAVPAEMRPEGRLQDFSLQVSSPAGGPDLNVTLTSTAAELRAPDGARAELRELRLEASATLDGELPAPGWKQARGSLQLAEATLLPSAEAANGPSPPPAPELAQRLTRRLARQLTRPALSVELLPTEAGQRLTAQLQIPELLQGASLQLGWNQEQELREVTGRVEQLELAPLLPWLAPPAELEIEGHLDLRAETLEEPPGQPRLELQASLDSQRLALSDLRMEEAALELVASTPLPALAHALSADAPLPVALDARIQGKRLEVPAQGSVHDFQGVSLEIRGPLLLPQPAESGSTGAEPEAESVLAQLATVLDGELSVLGRVASSSTLPQELLPLELQATGRALEDQAAPETALAVDGRLGTGGAGSGRIQGKVAAGDGDHATPLLDLRWSWALDRLEGLPRLLGELGLFDSGALPEDLRLGGSSRLQGRLRGPAKSPRLDAEVRVTDGLLATGETRLEHLAITTRASWAALLDSRRPVVVEQLEVRGRGTVAPLAPLPFRLQAGGRWRSEAPATGFPAAVPAPGLDLGGLELTSLDLVAGPTETEVALLEETAALGRLQLTPAEGAGNRWTLRLKGVELPAWRRTLEPLVGDPAPGLRFQGQAAAELEVRRSGGGWEGAGSANLSSTGFASDDGARVLEGLASRWTVEGALTHEALSLSASGEMDGFLLLWDTFFADFSNLESQVGATATLPIASEEAARKPWNAEARWSLPEGRLLQATVDGPEEDGAGLRYTANLTLEDLQATFRRHLREPLVTAMPELAELAVGGQLEAVLNGRIAAGPPEARATTVLGDLNLAGIQLHNPAQELTVEDLYLSLPLDLRLPRNPDPAADTAAPRPRRGTLGYSSIAFRDLRLPAVASRLLVRGDRVRLEEPLVVPVLGGEVELRRLILADLLGERSVEGSLRVSGLQLRRLSESLGLFPLEGTVEAVLPEVRLVGDRLEVEGGGRARLFGGTVEVSDIGAEGLFDPFPRFRLSAQFENLHLEQITRQLDFGEMTGRIEGGISDLLLVGGSPVRFDAVVRSVTPKQERRTVGVKAINNIAILGTGASAGTNILDRGIHRLFDRYTYSALGVAMTLQGDAFRLRGLEYRGDQELFLRGAFPFPIDVINAQPGGTVSFQAMVRRLQNLDLESATTRPQQ